MNPQPSEKICVSCGVDCSTLTRFKDPLGRYYCQNCYERIQKAEAAPRPGPTPPPLPSQVCPACQTPLPAGSMSCNRCGYDFVAGQHPQPGPQTRPTRAPSKGNPLKLLSKIAIILLLLLVIGVAVSTILNRARGSSREIDGKLEAIRKEGYPVTVAELDQWYKAPTTGNAATTYLEAISVMAPDTSKMLQPLRQGQGVLLPRRGPLAAQTKKNIDTLLSENARALELFHQGAAIAEARYPIDLKLGINTQLPHLVQLREASQLLQAEAFGHVENGVPGRAVASIMANSSLANSLAQEPTMISQLVRIGIQTIALQSLERVLTKGGLADDQLKGLQRVLAETEQRGGMSRAFAGERCMQIHFYSMTPQEREKLITSQMAGAPEPNKTPAVFKERFLRRDFLFFLDVMQNYIQATQSPFPERTKTVEEIARRVQQRRKDASLAYSPMMLTPMQNTIVKDTRNAAHLRAAQVALAVERFRLAHGNALPDSLERLAPDCISEVPKDPFDGKPLRFRKFTTPGYVVYSVGEDGIDNNGLEASVRPAGPKAPKGAKTDDVAFVVER